jgi:hypothetical protein
MAAETNKGDYCADHLRDEGNQQEAGSRVTVLSECDSGQARADQANGDDETSGSRRSAVLSKPHGGRRCKKWERRPRQQGSECTRFGIAARCWVVDYSRQEVRLNGESGSQPESGNECAPH